METWTWWSIWVGLSIFGAVYLGYLGWDLLNKASRALKEFELGAKRAQPLLEALQASGRLSDFEANLLDDPAPLAAEHQRNLRKRLLKRQDRQRRLINKLIDYDESEFKP